MAKVREVLVRRQVSDQVWYEAVDLQKLTMEQIHALSKNKRSFEDHGDIRQNS